VTVTAPAILIVEDNDKNLKLFRTLFEMRGFAPVSARSAAEAFACADRNPPDVVVLDIGLPDLPGTDVLASLRGNPATAGCTVVAVTAYAMVGDRERLLAAGFDGYIAKPIQATTFVDDVLAARNGRC
jgi:two-component system cell cycle response regulator